MAYLTPGSNEDIYQLLSQHNFTVINQNIDKYKCTICQRILINAYQAVCGCNYCQKCVDEQVRSGVMFCPGDTEECTMAALSSVSINHGKNKRILRLLVKCPEEMCCYESQLRNIGDHLRLCAMSVECPFTDFGCFQGKLKRDALNEHLRQESYGHSHILIGVIGNLRNELAELKRDREKYDTVIDKLVKSDREKAVIIDAMKEEIELMKLEKAVLEQRVNNLGNILDGKADRTVLEQQMDNLGNILDGKVDKIVVEIEEQLEEMRRDWIGTIELHQFALSNVEKGNEMKYRAVIAERTDSVEKCLAEKIDADFVWTIDNITEMRQTLGCMFSGYFNGCSEPYTMQLRCGYYGNELCFHFLIESSDSDNSLHWPFRRNVTIAITNQKRENVHKVITNRCKITKPLTNSYRWSDPFKFRWDELSNEGLLHDNHFTVQCFIRHR